MGIHGRKRVSDVAELRDDIVNTLLRILGLDCAFQYHVIHVTLIYAISRPFCGNPR